MTGLRRRISFGFISIVGVLVLSGMVSYYELSNLSRDTEDLLGVSRKYKTLSARMYTLLRDHNGAFVQMTAFDNREYDSLSFVALSALDGAISEAGVESQIPDVVDSMALRARALREITERFVATPSYDPNYDILLEEFPALDSLSAGYGKRIYEEYRSIYGVMVSDVDRYVAESQLALAPDATQLRSNAYRAVTPVLISLIVMIAIVLMLFYFVVTYCVTPLLKINKSLKDYLAFKVPFAPKGNRRDEMQELCDRIDTLIKQSKISKSE